MSLQDVFPFVTGAGGAIFALMFGYVLLLAGRLVTGHSHAEVVAGKDQIIAYKDALIADKERQIAALTIANAHERERGDAGILAAQVTREVVEGIRKAVPP